MSTRPTASFAPAISGAPCARSATTFPPSAMPSSAGPRSCARSRRDSTPAPGCSPCSVRAAPARRASSGATAGPGSATGRAASTSAICPRRVRSTGSTSPSRLRSTSRSARTTPPCSSATPSPAAVAAWSSSTTSSRSCEHAPATLGRWLDRAPGRGLRRHQPRAAASAGRGESSPSSRCRWKRTRSSSSRRALARSGRTSCSTTPTAPPSPRSCDCSTVCRSRSSWRPRGCGCSRLRNSSSACATASRLLAGARGAAARQATLRAAIDWSWDLLAPWEQAAFAQCSVFEGGFTLEAAEAVLDLSPWPAGAAGDGRGAGALGQEPAAHVGARRAEPLRHRGAVLRHVSRASTSTRRRSSTPSGAAGESAGRGTARAILRALRHRRGDRGAFPPRRRQAAPRARARARQSRRRVPQGGAPRQTASTRSRRICAIWEVLELQGPCALGIDLGAQVLAVDTLDASQRAAALQARATALSPRRVAAKSRRRCSSKRS